MISYQDGTETKVGDSALIEQGRTPGVIADLIDSAAEQPAATSVKHGS